ncbi:hypothetical protein [Paenibacillus sp. P3E]|uniref:hypothetical protein n=1 Tax=Paenibacillus sp. P3E TaxID=1349435 RepID=UPI0015BE3A64|nr:hypothetical protein [Paenibacillus sp. P3E]
MKPRVLDKWRTLRRKDLVRSERQKKPVELAAYHSRNTVIGSLSQISPLSWKPKLS